MIQEEEKIREDIDRINLQMEKLYLEKSRLTEMLSEDESEQEQPFGFRMVEQLVPEGSRVVFQGVEGAYSHQAMLQFFGRSVRGNSVPTFETAVRSIVSGEADFAVLPVENTTGGAIGDVLDLQMKYPCYSAAEISIPIQHVLLGLPGTDISGIHTVYSHPQGIAQCAEFLEEHPDWNRIPRSNTAASAKQIAEERDPGCAAIASELAGELYGLEVLKRDIATNAGNTTRFMIMTGRPIFRREAQKVSICFQCLHKTGHLYRMLSYITFHGLNMTRIESRPVPGQNFEYRFFVEFEGNLTDPQVRRALRGIQHDSDVFRVLGCVEE